MPPAPTPSPPPPEPEPEPAAPSPAELQEAAARRLLAHIKSGGARGVRNRPSPKVKAAQAAMGGLVADGIYGPKTRARGAALLGQPFPPR